MTLMEKSIDFFHLLLHEMSSGLINVFIREEKTFESGSAFREKKNNKKHNVDSRKSGTNVRFVSNLGHLTGNRIAIIWRQHLV